MNVFFTGFPDFHIKLLHRSPIFNNTQFLHWEMTGTNSGEFAGSPATGKKVKVSGLSRIHFNGSGKVDEENVFYNELDLMKQLGKTLN
jgi:predicted ester cyclase